MVANFHVLNFDNDKTFYTDSNGLEMQKRILNYRPTWNIEDNYVDDMKDFFNRCNLFHGLPEECKIRLARKCCIINYPART